MVNDDELRSSLQLLTTDQPIAPADRLDGVRRIHRRRRQLQSAVAGAAVVALLGAAIGVAVGLRPGSSHPTPTHRTGWQLPWHGAVIDDPELQSAFVSAFRESDAMSTQPGQVDQVKWVSLVANTAGVPSHARYLAFFEAAKGSAHYLVAGWMNASSPANAHVVVLPAPSPTIGAIGARLHGAGGTGDFVVGRPGLASATLTRLTATGRSTRQISFGPGGHDAVYLPREPSAAAVSDGQPGHIVLTAPLSSTSTSFLRADKWPVAVAGSLRKPSAVSLSSVPEVGQTVFDEGAQQQGSTLQLASHVTGWLSLEVTCLGPQRLTISVGGNSRGSATTAACNGTTENLQHVAPVRDGDWLHVTAHAVGGTTGYRIVPVLTAAPASSVPGIDTAWQLPWHATISDPDGSRRTQIVDAFGRSTAQPSDVRWIYLGHPGFHGLDAGRWIGLFEASVGGQPELVAADVSLGDGAASGTFYELSPPVTDAEVVTAQVSLVGGQTGFVVVGRPGITRARLLTWGQHHPLTSRQVPLVGGVAAVTPSRGTAHERWVSAAWSGSPLTAVVGSGTMLDNGSTARNAWDPADWPGSTGGLTNRVMGTTGAQSEGYTYSFRAPSSGRVQVALRCFGPTGVSIGLTGVPGQSQDFAGDCDGSGAPIIADVGRASAGRRIGITVHGPNGDPFALGIRIGN